MQRLAQLREPPRDADQAGACHRSSDSLQPHTPQHTGDEAASSSGAEAGGGHYALGGGRSGSRAAAARGTTGSHAGVWVCAAGAVPARPEAPVKSPAAFLAADPALGACYGGLAMRRNLAFDQPSVEAAFLGHAGRCSAMGELGLVGGPFFSFISPPCSHVIQINGQQSASSVSYTSRSTPPAPPSPPSPPSPPQVGLQLIAFLAAGGRAAVLRSPLAVARITLAVLLPSAAHLLALGRCRAAYAPRRGLASVALRAPFDLWVALSPDAAVLGCKAMHKTVPLTGGPGARGWAAGGAAWVLTCGWVGEATYCGGWAAAAGQHCPPPPLPQASWCSCSSSSW